jgi:hypothetical protein
LAPRRLGGTRCDAYAARLLRRQPKAYMLPSASAGSSVLLGSWTAVINVRVDKMSFALPPPPLGPGPTDWARIPTIVKVMYVTNCACLVRVPVHDFYFCQ